MLWQLYSELENEVRELTYSVPFCREHRNVYSPRIAELIVRIGFQIESNLQKNSTSKINYNTIIKQYDKKWDFSEKYVLLNKKIVTPLNSDCLYLLPFKLIDDKKTVIGDKILYASKDSPNLFLPDIPKENRVRAYTWSNAYDNLKHNFYGSLKAFGTVQNLITILGALYIINIYTDPELKFSNHYDGISYTNNLDICKKSGLFSTLVLQAYVIENKLIIDLVKNLKFDNFSFINIKNIELAQKIVNNTIGDNWEFMTEEYKRYNIPKIVKECFPDFDMYKNYDITIRNESKQKDLDK